MVQSLPESVFASRQKRLQLADELEIVYVRPVDGFWPKVVRHVDPVADITERVGRVVRQPA